jgi:hypothetical protein
MHDALEGALKTTRALQSKARAASQALRVLEDELGRHLGTFDLEQGEPVTDEVLAFVRLATHGQQGPYRLTVSTVTAVANGAAGTDQREHP